MRRDDYQFAWDPSSEKWVVNVPFPSLLHVNQESRYEALKHFVVMQPQQTHRSCAYYHLNNTALVFRYGFDSYGWWGFLGWLNQHIGELQRDIKHLVFEQESCGNEALPELVDRFPGKHGFWGVDWRLLKGLKSFNVAYLNGGIGEIAGFAEDEDADEHRQRQAELIVDLEPNPAFTTWNPDISVRFGTFVFAN